jgi:hypothetical protein
VLFVRRHTNYPTHEYGKIVDAIKANRKRE